MTRVAFAIIGHILKAGNGEKSRVSAFLSPCSTYFLNKMAFFEKASLLDDMTKQNAESKACFLPSFSPCTYECNPHLTPRGAHCFEKATSSCFLVRISKTIFLNCALKTFLVVRGELVFIGPWNVWLPGEVAFWAVCPIPASKASFLTWTFGREGKIKGNDHHEMGDRTVVLLP